MPATLQKLGKNVKQSKNSPPTAIRGQKLTGTRIDEPESEQERFNKTLQNIQAHASPQTLRMVTAALEEALPEKTGAKIGAVAQEHLRLEFNALKGAFAFRRQLLEGAITVADATELLAISRQAVNERVRKGQLIAIQDAGKLRFPLWQFDASEPDGVVVGLMLVARTLDEISPVSPLSKMSWLTRRQEALEGRSPIEALRKGELDAVLAAARAVNAV